MDTWFKAQKTDAGEGHIAIFSDIGMWGVTANDFRRELDAIGDVDVLNVAIGSNGGDVFTGFNIYNMLARHKAHKVVTIEGLAASMASVIAMAGDEVVMPENSMLMIHNPFGNVAGEADEVKSFGEALSKMQANIIQAYRNRTGLSAKEIGAMMDKTTWLDAKDAKAKGFADRIEKPVAIVNAVDVSKFSNVPAAYGRASTEETPMTTETPKAKTEAEVRAEVRVSVLAHAKEVRSMCALAGFPEMADKLVDDGTDLSGVVAALNTARAAKGEDTRGKGKGKGATTEINARVPAEGGDAEDDAELDPNAVFAKWNSPGAR